MNAPSEGMIDKVEPRRYRVIAVLCGMHSNSGDVHERTPNLLLMKWLERAFARL